MSARSAVRLAWMALPLAVFLSQPVHAETGVTDAAIRLGMVNVQTGPAAALGQGMLDGASAVFADVNARGGVHGRAIELKVADDGYEPDRAIDETLAMIEEEEVFSLFGYVGTPTANAVLPIVREYEVPLVALFTGAGTLRSPVTRQVFNVRASYDDEAEAMVEHFVRNGAKTVGVFYQDDGFGKAVLSGAEKALARRGMKVHVTGTFKRNTLAVKQGLAKMVAARPDAVVMVGPYAPLAEFVKEARKAGLGSQLATVSFVGTDSLVSALGKDGDGVVITQVVPFPHREGLALVDDCRRLLERHGGKRLGFVNLEGCLSAKIMVEGLQAAGPEPTRAGLIDALERMKRVDVGGVEVSFAPDNHQALGAVFLTAIHDGRIVEID